MSAIVSKTTNFYNWTAPGVYPFLRGAREGGLRRRQKVRQPHAIVLGHGIACLRMMRKRIMCDGVVCVFSSQGAGNAARHSLTLGLARSIREPRLRGGYATSPARGGGRLAASSPADACAPFGFGFVPPPLQPALHLPWHRMRKHLQNPVGTRVPRARANRAAHRPL